MVIQRFMYKAIKSLAFASFLPHSYFDSFRFFCFGFLFLGFVCSKWQIVKCAEMWKKCLFKKEQEEDEERRTEAERV